MDYIIVVAVSCLAISVVVCSYLVVQALVIGDKIVDAYKNGKR